MENQLNPSVIELQFPEYHHWSLEINKDMKFMWINICEKKHMWKETSEAC